jgi:hypothetical protein
MTLLFYFICHLTFHRYFYYTHDALNISLAGQWMRVRRLSRDKDAIKLIVDSASMDKEAKLLLSRFEIRSGTSPSASKQESLSPEEYVLAPSSPTPPALPPSSSSKSSRVAQANKPATS